MQNKSLNYQEAYNLLNANQREAVDCTEGALMVVAGPGTGKTQVLGARVASILLNTDASPENILCLTFTEAATTALRKRLYEFIGSIAYKVNVSTYHGFCNNVIQENKDYFGIQDLDAVSELETAEILKEIIDELPHDSKIKRYVGNVYYDINDLKRLFGLLKKDNLSSDDIQQMVDDKLEKMRYEDEYRYKTNYRGNKKGDLKTNKYNTDKVPLEKLKEAALLMNVYNTKLKSRGRYDFNDMIRWVLDALQSNEDLLLQYQEQYQYFLVDEYQDTNGIQNDLLYTLISYWENPNVFVVGDDDQSIYRFQGANVQNIYEFYSKYQKYIKLVVLDKNYRSSQNILDGSGSIISNNEERLVGKVERLTKDIIASNDEVSSITDSLKIVEYQNTYHEVVSITTKIKELNVNGVSFKDIGILYRNHSQSEELIKFLESEEIDYNVSKTQDILQIPLIKQLNTFLTYLSLESKSLDSGQHLLFDLLHFKNFKYLSSFDIARMSAVLAKDYNSGWREQMNLTAEKLDLALEAKRELKHFIEDVEYWLKEMYNLTLQTLVERIMSKLGYVSRALSSHDATFLIQCLKTYYNFLKEETSRNPYLTLSEFLGKIDLLVSHNLGLKLNKIIRGSNGVNLMTVHGSKGLEFDYVFMLGCTERKWEKDAKSLPYKLNLLLPGEPKKASEEESRRLFYVGMTRARKHLEVSYPVKDEKDKDLTKSLFVVELEESGKAELLKASPDESAMKHFFDFMLRQEDKEYTDLIHQDFVKYEVENFRLSATNLNSYLRCPVAFFYQNILRVPSAKGESSTFGTAIHYALDGLFKQWEEISTESVAKEILRSRFKKAMNSSKEAFTKEGLERRLYYGETILEKYYDKYSNTWNDNGEVFSELYLKNCEIDGVPIRGQIDKVNVINGNAHVTDFKTGQVKYGKKKVSPPAMLEDNPNEANYEKRYGGDYWRQIIFYKALIESDSTQNLKVISGEIDFIEPEKDEFVKMKIVISEEEYSFVRNQIKNVYTSIQNLEFRDGCEEPDCQWCNFNALYATRKVFRNETLLDIPPE